MTMTTKNLAPAQSVPTTQTPVYTVTAPQANSVRAVIDAATVSNTTAGVLYFSANIVPADGVAGADNLVRPSVAIRGGAVYHCPELVGHVLSEGASLSVLASAAGLVLNVSGREITT